MSLIPYSRENMRAFKVMRDEEENVMKKEIIELKEQIDYQGNEISNLQDHIEKMEEELFTTTTEL